MLVGKNVCQSAAVCMNLMYDTMKKTAKSFPASKISILRHTVTSTCMVVDGGDTPLLYMPGVQAARQGLARRQVVVALFTPEGKLVVCRQPVALAPAVPVLAGGRPGPGEPPLLALPSGFVEAGEAREDAALRLYAEYLFCVPPVLRQVASAGPGPEQPHFRTLYGARMPTDLHASFFHAPGVFSVLDADELTGLVEDAAELLQPELAWAVRQPGFFAASRLVAEEE